MWVVSVVVVACFARSLADSYSSFFSTGLALLLVFLSVVLVQDSPSAQEIWPDLDLWNHPFYKYVRFFLSLSVTVSLRFALYNERMGLGAKIHAYSTVPALVCFASSTPRDAHPFVSPLFRICFRGAYYAPFAESAREQLKQADETLQSRAATVPKSYLDCIRDQTTLLLARMEPIEKAVQKAVEQGEIAAGAAQAILPELHKLNCELPLVVEVCTPTCSYPCSLRACCVLAGMPSVLCVIQSVPHSPTFHPLHTEVCGERTGQGNHRLRSAGWGRAGLFGCRVLRIRRFSGSQPDCTGRGGHIHDGCNLRRRSSAQAPPVLWHGGLGRSLLSGIKRATGCAWRQFCLVAPARRDRHRRRMG